MTDIYRCVEEVLRVVITHAIKSGFSLNSSDSRCALHVRDVERLVFAPHITLANSDVIIGCCMVVIYSGYYVNVLTISMILFHAYIYIFIYLFIYYYYVFVCVSF